MTEGAPGSRRIILAVACYAMAAGSTLILGAAACLSVIAADLGMETELSKGLFLSSPIWSSAITSVSSGWLVDRLGYRLQILISSLMQAAGLIVIATATEPLHALAGGTINGLGRGIVSAPMTALLCDLYAENRVRIAGIHHSSWYIGMCVILLLVLAAFELDVGWRSLFGLFTVLVLIYAPAAFLKSVPGRRAARSERSRERIPFREVAGHWSFRLLLLGLFFSTITEVTASLWMPYYLEISIGSSRSFGAISLMVYALVMATGRLTMPLIVNRFGLRTVVTITGLACLIASPLAAWHDHPFAVVAWLSLLGFAVSGIYPSVNAHAGDRFPTAGSAMFAAFNGTALLGALTGPIAFGMTADYVGLRWALAATTVAPLAWMSSLAFGVRSEIRTDGRSVSHASGD